MIYSLTANKPSFHAVHFHKGLNLVVSTRSSESSLTDSRNARGKTTLLQIIDFCLGADSKNKENLPVKLLPEWIFTLELDIRGQRVKVSRSTDSPSLVTIDGDVSSWPVLPDELALDGVHTYTIEQWTKILGWAFFDIEIKREKNDAPDDKLAMPSMRSLFHYFIRRSFENPLAPVTASGSDSMSIAYLLGLNWQYISRINNLKKEEKQASTVQSAAKIQLAKWKSTELSLRSSCNYLESSLKEIKEQLPNLNVIPGYAEIKENVDKLTLEIHGLTNKVISEQTRLTAASTQLRKTREALLPVEELYQQCGLTFPDAVKEELENVKAFHEAITGNRRIILNKEIRRLKKSIKDTNSLIYRKAEEKRSAMQIIKTSTAIDEYTRMMQRYTDLSRELQTKLDCLRHIAEAKAELEQILNRKNQIAEEARIEYDDLQPIWQQSDSFFQSLVSELLNKQGTLGIKMVGEKKTWGFTFDPKIIDQRSSGYKKIKVFAFDLTIYHQQRVCQHPIDFIIHDSELLDSTDPRQAAKALLAADKISRELDGQYICTINSNKLKDAEFNSILPEKEIEKFTVLTLSDKSDKERLLGIAFGDAINAENQSQGNKSE